MFHESTQKFLRAPNQSLDYKWLDYDCMSYSQNTTETEDMMYDINL